MTDLALRRSTVDHGLGPRVVLVHGSMDRGSSFHRVLGRLGGLEVIRYDRRGYGRSLDRGQTDVEGHARDLVALCRDQPSVLIGHSLGGVIALAAADLAPGVALGVGAYEAPMQWEEWWPSRSTGGAATQTGDPKGAAEVFLRRMLGDERWEKMPAALKAERQAEGAALLGELRSVRRGPPYDIDAIVAAGVVVRAAHGTEGARHHIESARRLAAAVGQPGGPFVIEGAGHGAHLSHPDEFATFVRSVVGDADRRDR